MSLADHDRDYFNYDSALNLVFIQSTLVALK